MKLVRTLSMFIALAAASTTVHADTPAKTAPAKAPEADKKAPAPAKEELGKADVERAEKFFDEFLNAVVKNQDACPKMATAVNGVFDKHQAWLVKMAESGKDIPQSSKDKLQKKQGELMNAVMKCKDDKGVQAALQRFMMLGAKKKSAEAAPPAAAAPTPAAPPAKK